MRFTIRSLNIGDVRVQIDTAGRAFRSAVRREPFDGSHDVDERGFAGDASAYAGHHGPNMAISVFSFDRYAHFEALAGRSFPIPAFGENLTTAGGLEDEICIGDHFNIGTAIAVVTQPTERCATLGPSLGLPALRKWATDCLYSGYYMRVVRPGAISAGDAFELIDRSLPKWSVDRVNRVVFREFANDALVDEMLALEPLSKEWKARVRVLRRRRDARVRRSERPLLPSSS